MSLRSNLPNLMKDAMRARDQVRLDTIRFVMSQMKNAEIDLKREMTDDEFIALLKKELKNRKEAIEQFKTGGREDIVVEEEAKLKVIQEFLPAEMSDADLQVAVENALKNVTDKSNFGLVMKAVMAEVKGQADGKRVTEAVKTALA
ncbi:MAG: GatB/YqeY domain-containing protein [Patescibacteria group bacterium]